jgi:hypothetical protein
MSLKKISPMSAKRRARDGHRCHHTRIELYARLRLAHRSLGIGNALVTYGIQLFSGQYRLRSSKFGAFSSFGGDLVNTTYGFCAPALFLRIVEDASNRTYFLSADFKNWIQIAQEAVTTYITTTQYGFYARGTGASTCQQNATVLSWSETTP